MVVVGILIALSINNWNEERKEENEFDRLLINIQKELEENIYHIDIMTPTYFLLDSITYIIRNRQVTEEMLVQNNIFTRIGYRFSGSAITNEAFKNLINLNREYDKSQDSIIKLLKDIFIGKKTWWMEH